MSMKGLTQFIADLRGARSHEQEQLRINKELQNIRDKFADPSLNAYNKRKYVAKLCYIYILGYPVSMGKTEALALIKMPQYAEKQIGYLCMTLMHTQGDAMDLALPTVFGDLAAMDDVCTCLALSYLGSVQTIFQRAPEEVYKLLISPTSTDFVRKKAALVLLHFYRRVPESIEDQWVDRIVALLDSSSIGVALCAAALVKAIVADNFWRCPNAFSAALNRISGVFLKHKISPDYIYYQVPCPWLLVRLLEIVQLYPPGFAQTQPGQADVLEMQLSGVLLEVAEQITAAIHKISTSNDAAQRLNASNAVFFEVVNGLEHHQLLAQQTSLQQKVFETLTMFLNNKQATVRFLSLNCLVSLHKFPQVKSLENKLLKLLRDRDISVRRKCIDLLFNITDKSNVEHIAAELLDYLPLSDSLIRKDVATVLAQLIEDCATSKRWYLDTTLSLLMIGGSSVSAQIWQRLVQFIMKNHDIQAYTASAVLEYLKEPECSTQMIKVGAYILGEYGELVAHQQGQTPEDQYLALLDKLGGVSGASAADANILTAYAKFANSYPGLRSQISETLEQYTKSSDNELHQRAIEYRQLLAHASLLPVVWDKMPLYGEQPSSLMAPVAKHKVTLTRQNTGIKRGAGALGGAGGALGGAPGSAGASTASLTGSGVAGARDPTALAPPTRPPLTSMLSSSSLTKDTILSTNWEHGFRRMLTHNQGTLFQDALVQVGCHYEFPRASGQGSVFLRLCNISDRVITGLSVTVHNPMGERVLSLSTKNIPQTTLKRGETTELVVVCEALQPFAVSPLCRVQYFAGAFSEMNFRLPIVIERFMFPTAVSEDEFHARWDQIGPEGEFRKTFKNFSSTKVKAIVADDAEVVANLGYALVSSSPLLVLGASILHTNASGNYGCLLRLEPDADRKNITVCVRSTKKIVSVVLTKNVSNVYQL